jgi:hypothetical protein
MIIPEFSTRGCQLSTLIPSTVVPQNSLGSHCISHEILPRNSTTVVADTLSFAAILNSCVCQILQREGLREGRNDMNDTTVLR